MKKLRKIFILLFAVTLLIPFSIVNVDAEKETTTTANGENEETTTQVLEKEPVKIYFFHGETCKFCRAALEWFDSIEEEYGDYFDLVKYEVWNNEENHELMASVAEFMGDDASGVPYIVLGKYTYPNGFGADTTIDSEGTTMGDEMISRIMELYESDERYDVMEEMAKKPNYDTVVAVVAGIVVVGLVAVAVITRRSSN